MQQRDFIKAEIERLGRAIGKLITLVSGTAGGDMTSGLRQSAIHHQLREELGIAVARRNSSGVPPG